MHEAHAHPHPHDHSHDHVHHEHGHHHEHQDHGHDHHHGEAENAYYLDQLCMVGLAGAFGGICLSLYFWKTGMLTLLLGPQFFKFILISGITLVVLAVLRGVVLWIEAGKRPGHVHDQTHEIPPESHQHPEHVAATRDLPVVESHEHCCGEHHIGHAHGHHHHGHQHHDHDCADHEHGWAPWRYVVLLLPVLFFMLGLPNRGPQVMASAVNVEVDMTKQAASAASVMGLGAEPLVQVAAVGGLFKPADKAVPIGFKDLNDYASNEKTREQWEHTTIKVKAQYSPDPGNPRLFYMVKYRMQCCAGDAVAIQIPAFSPEPITHVKIGDWIWATGQIEFTKRDNKYVTLVRLAGASAVEKTTPEVNPYAN